MHLNEQKQKEFETSARPLVKWLNENCHPHVFALVEPGRIALVEGVYATQVLDYIED
uniref:Uncharacterized protein n=1 Tax=viral metagenome TaxID=1070528 RepID=A0A6M3LT84_9ZZZZ